MDTITTTIAQTPRSLSQGTCRICARPLIHTVVDLGMSPLCETFLTLEQTDRMEPYFPLHALVCDGCFLVQLKEYVAPEEIFREYAYFSSYSTSWVDHAASYCRMITDRAGLDASSLVVEIASNDGYLLQHFIPLGIPVLGVEPAANVAQVAIARGITTRVDFFDLALADELVRDGKQADVIVANNVLAQVPDLNTFVAAMTRLLKPTGVITVEFPHLQELLAENQFDTIYHEHFSYFSLTTVDLLAGRHGLKVVDVERLRTHGGSLRVYMAHAGAGRSPTAHVSAILDEEKRRGLQDVRSYAAFSEQVRATKRKLLSFLITAKDAGKTICGYGAPGKGNTLLNYCAIGTDFLDFTVDRNPYKHGRFTPGMHIPIHPIEMIAQARPDYVLILPWNLRQEIMPQLDYVGDWGGKFVIPIPQVTIINPRGAVP
jgi:SAM-dependent methyltransferase